MAFSNLKNINIVGVMGMATFTEDETRIRREFQNLKAHYDKTKEILSDINVLSMGMSADFEIAIAEGSTMVRIGSSIFGTRNYH